MDSPRNPPLRARIAEEAAHWVQRLAHDPSPACRAEFDRWIGQGVLHMEEFLFAQATWTDLNGLDASFELGAPDARRGGSIIEFPVPVDRRHPSSSEPRRNARAGAGAGRRLLGGAFAAVLLAGILSALTGTWPFGPQVYATQLGEQKTFKLDDGSVIYLNTQSRVEVSYSSQARTLRLLDGEAMFKVQPDPSRPFHVLTDNARIRAIGTQFNVFRDNAAETRVSVVEGVVQVTQNAAPATAPSPAAPPAPGPSAMRLTAGDEANIARGAIAKAAHPNVTATTAWRTRKLVFDDNSLAQIVRQFNRYNPVQLKVEGEGVAAYRIGGVFDADDFKPLLNFLANDPRIAIVEGPHEVLIRPR